MQLDKWDLSDFKLQVLLKNLSENDHKSKILH